MKITTVKSYFLLNVYGIILDKDNKLIYRSECLIHIDKELFSVNYVKLLLVVDGLMMILIMIIVKLFYC
jgi:hypothetical protein